MRIKIEIETDGQTAEEILHIAKRHLLEEVFERFNRLEKTLERIENTMSNDFSKLEDEVAQDIAADEAALTKITDLESQLAAAQAANDQAEIDKITTELAAERAKLAAATAPPTPPTA